MENGFFSKLNLYDQVGYLLVGSIGALVIVVDLVLLGKSSILPSLSSGWLILWAIIAYFIGHVIQSIANFIFLEKKEDFSEAEKLVLETARSHFGLTDRHSLKDIYLHCYMLACSKDITGHVASFNAYYSMYRGWYTIFFLESIALSVIAIIHWPNISALSLVTISIVFSFLFRRRLTRFYNYSREKTLQTFVLISKSSKQ